MVKRWSLLSWLWGLGSTTGQQQ